jgi:hypothetical protein
MYKLQADSTYIETQVKDGKELKEFNKIVTFA